MVKSNFILICLIGIVCCSCAITSNDKGMDAYNKGEYDKALLLFLEGCDKNDSTACYNLGYIYKNGGAVDIDVSKTVEFFDKSCLLENDIACDDLAEMYENGDGIPKQIDMAEHYYEKACNLQNYKACISGSRLRGNKGHFPALRF